MRSSVRRWFEHHWARSTGRYDPLGVPGSAPGGPMRSSVRRWFERHQARSAYEISHVMPLFLRKRGHFRLSKNLKITAVIANQSADWFAISKIVVKTMDYQQKMLENPGDCHVGLRPPRNDTLF